MYVNNEVGTVQPIAEAARIVKQYQIRQFCFTQMRSRDSASTGSGRNVWESSSDRASGRKIHGPKGIGFLYIGSNVKIRPIVFGGEQQKNIRSGTENVPGIAGLALASKMIYRDLEMKTALMRELKGRFLEGIKKIDNTVVHGLTDEGSAPHIISVGIAGIRSEVLLHTLEEKGIYVSSGSACSSNHPSVSGVLKGIGAAREYLDAHPAFQYVRVYNQRRN